MDGTGDAYTRPRTKDDPWFKLESSTNWDPITVKMPYYTSIPNKYRYKAAGRQEASAR